MIRTRGFIFSNALVFLAAMTGANCVHAAELIQNSNARQSISLNGEWRVIVDPYENGFYNHRYEEKSDGYFKNAKPREPSELVEYDFSVSQTLDVPGD